MPRAPIAAFVQLVLGAPVSGAGILMFAWAVATWVPSRDMAYIAILVYFAVFEFLPFVGSFRNGA